MKKIKSVLCQVEDEFGNINQELVPIEEYVLHHYMVDATRLLFIPERDEEKFNQLEELYGKQKLRSKSSSDKTSEEKEKGGEEKSGQKEIN